MTPTHLRTERASQRRLGTAARVRTIVAAAALLTVVGCGTAGDEAGPEGTLEINRTTTTTARPCDVPETAERAITEASLTATRADDAAKQATGAQLDLLEATLPASLVDEVGVLRQAFDTAWALTPEDAAETDPFDTAEYLVADQAIRRYVESNCTDPSE